MRQVVKDNLQTNFKELGISLKFVRDDATDTHSIFAQSKVENRETGFDSAKEKTEFRKQLKAALVKLNSKEPITELKGSDSIEEFKTKQVTYDVMTEFKKAEGKYVKVSKVKKPKATKRSAVDSQKKQKSKVVRSEIAKAAIPKTRLSPGESRTEPSMFSLVALINQKLPETVEKNMGPPALTNVTGRFANSVRVTDVIPTAQGFPSIGYTYRKSPYQTFETGNKQGDAERDPRKLINRSIREIAAEMAIGRFYTRRV
jgi:flagellar hook-basal body complex protein FliE